MPVALMTLLENEIKKYGSRKVRMLARHVLDNLFNQNTAFNKVAGLN